MVRVLFVCLGNICRSPMAEAVFRHKVRAAGLEDKIEADSAGTGHWHVGSAPHPGTRAMLTRHAIEYTHAARLVSRKDFDTFDYVLAMDNANLNDLQALGKGRAPVRLFLDYAPNSAFREVPDPYLTGGFEGVYDLVTEAAEGVLTAIREEHGL